MRRPSTRAARDAPPAGRFALLGVLSACLVACDTTASATHVTLPPTPFEAMAADPALAAQPAASPAPSAEAGAPAAPAEVPSKVVHPGSRLKPRELFGFATYWTLGAESGYQYSDLTTIAYFGLDANGDGSLQR